MSSKFITKYDFLNYFKKPYCFWFLIPEEMDDILEKIDDEEMDDIFNLLRDLDKFNSIFISNLGKLSRIKNQKLINCYKKIFKLPNLSIYDFSLIRENVLERVINLVSNNDFIFIYQPLLLWENLQIRPTSILKYKGLVYLIDHFWSSTLKRENLSSFIFYDYFFKKSGKFKIDQYLISYLSKLPSDSGDLLVEICNSLPHSIQKYVPLNFYDSKLKNINSYFGLVIEYRNSLYELICSPEEYLFLDHEVWNFSIDIEKPILELSDYLSFDDKSVSVERIVSDFFDRKNKVIKPDNSFYRYFLYKYFDFKLAASLLSFEKLMKKLSENKMNFDTYLNFLSNWNFADFMPDQDYLIFKEAKSEFFKLTYKKIKIYYDFESLMLPFPILEKTKANFQIVLQLSLIKIVDGKEVYSNNVVLDPRNIKIDDFKRIIDSIYSDELDVVFIVYNRSFENTRLKEMAELINEEEYFRKVIEIIDKTVDLADWFKIGKKPRLILKYLKGFYSIKEVSKHIPLDIFKKTGTVNYSDLKCKNGMMATHFFLSRWLNEDEDAWNRSKDFLIKYCTNDVRTMIAVESFIERLILENKYDLK